MGIKGKYEPLTQFPLSCGKKEITLTVEQISDIVLGGLPPWVYNSVRRPWSASHNPGGPMSAAWLKAGYVIKEHSSRSVTFKKQ